MKISSSNCQISNSKFTPKLDQPTLCSMQIHTHTHNKPLMQSAQQFSFSLIYAALQYVSTTVCGHPQGVQVRRRTLPRSLININSRTRKRGYLVGFSLDYPGFESLQNKVISLFWRRPQGTPCVLSTGWVFFFKNESYIPLLVLFTICDIARLYISVCNVVQTVWRRPYIKAETCSSRTYKENVARSV